MSGGCDPHDVFPASSKIKDLEALKYDQTSLDRALAAQEANQLKKWICDLRDEHCPATSYSATSRASKSLVLGWGDAGNVAIEFARSDGYFRLVYCCEKTCERAKFCSSNTELYHLEKYIKVSNCDVWDWMRSNYKKSSPGAPVVLRLDSQDPRSENLPSAVLELLSGAYFAPLTSSSSHQPSMPSFSSGSSPSSSSRSQRSDRSTERFMVPMVIVWIPPALDSAKETSRTSSIVGALMKLPTRRSFEKALKVKALDSRKIHRFVALIGLKAHEDFGERSAVGTNQPYKTAASRRQFTTLLRHKNGRHHDMYLRLKQLLAYKLKRCRLTHIKLVEHLHTLVEKKGQEDDEVIYSKLHKFFHEICVNTEEYLRWSAQEARKMGDAGKGTENVAGGNWVGRANYRVQEIHGALRGWFEEKATVLHHLKPENRKLESRKRPRHPENYRAVWPKSILDVGCSEGDITAAIGEGFNLKIENVHGCDIRDLDNTEGFTFTHFNGKVLPYPDGEFDMVFALMALHHIMDPLPMIKEIVRVLKPGGVFVLREHDCNSPLLPVVLDVMHGLFARVWSNPPEQPSFCDAYTAHYRPRSEWTKLIDDSGLMQHLSSPALQSSHLPHPVSHGRWIRNPYHYYWGVYSKPGASSE